jgi:hypothetical protein
MYLVLYVRGELFAGNVDKEDISLPTTCLLPFIENVSHVMQNEFMKHDLSNPDR